MSGIQAIDMLNYYNMTNMRFGQKKLTPLTRSKLTALGVDTHFIKTESEGLLKLREAETERTNSKNKNKDAKVTAEEQNLEDARTLAKKLDISVSDTYTLNDLISKIKAKINEMKVQAGNDFDKLESVGYYERRLAGIEDTQFSSINLSASMNITANMNIAFHGIY